MSFVLALATKVLEFESRQKLADEDMADSLDPVSEEDFKWDAMCRERIVNFDVPKDY